ncbi:hypothetical protein [Nocardia australiensis]|uniref:hypothetical protein n=1 Tax=Nocardia australiensis TaxID=2887191 RepID=UPI001D1468BC|nr:hypothetical protein [Nocardia australiensis]
MSTSAGSCDRVAAVYHPATTTKDGYTRPATVWIGLESTLSSTHATMFLDIDHVRELAQRLPELLMAHDAAEHARTEQAAAEKSVAESKAA